MTRLLDYRRRVAYGLGSVIVLALAITLALLGFAFSAVWPGISWALGTSLGIFGGVISFRWLRAALTGVAPSRNTNADAGRGAA